MNAVLEGLFLRAVRGLLRVYPPEFRACFGGEMAQVYRALAREVIRDGGAGGLLILWLRAVLDCARGALLQWGQRLTKRRMVTMNNSPMDAIDGTAALSPRQAFLAVLPFLLFGLSSIAAKLELVPVSSLDLPLWGRLLFYPYLLFVWFTLMGLAAGILLGFPRWAFSYLLWALHNAWWWSSVIFLGARWLPLLAVVGITLLFLRSLNPARTALAGLWRDLTLLALGVYILYTGMYMIADENHHPLLLLFIAATTLAVCLGAWGFFRSTAPLRRVLWLIGGLALAAALNIWSSLTWDYAAYYGLSESSSLWNAGVAVVFLVVLSIGMLGLAWLTHRRSRRKAA